MTASSPGKGFWYGAVPAILVFAAVLRAGTFFLGHASGDQLFYAALAMKLEKLGFSGYSLRDVGVADAPGQTGALLVHETKFENTLIHEQKKDGLTFYDTPVFYVPPLFATSIRLLHAASGGGDYYLSDKRFGRARWAPFSAEGKRELYATLLPFLASLLTIFAVLVFAGRYLGAYVAGGAGILLAASPVDILASNRVWPDSLLSFFLVLALFLLYAAAAEENPFWAMLAGISFGLALLTKGQALFFAPVAILWRLLSSDRKGLKLFLDPILWAFAGAAFWTSLVWFWAVARAYGSPFWTPPFPLPDSGAPRDWYLFVTRRPWYMYPLNLIFQNPAFLFAFFPFAFSLLTLAIREHKRLWSLLFCWVLSLPVLYLAFWPGKEERYLLPIYPALAVLSALSLEYARRGMNAEWKNRVGDWGISLLLAASCALSLPLAYSHLVIWQGDWIPLPF